MEEQNTPQPEVKEITPPMRIPDSHNEPAKLSRVKILILGICAVMVLASFAGAYFLGKNSSEDKPAFPNPSEKVCSQEAMICPDGSSVGRTGPNCEFSPCPTSGSTSITNYSDFLAKTKNLVAAKDTNGLVALQTEDEIECDPTSEGIVQTICEGASKGEIKTGYWLGRNQSEGSILPKTEYINEIKNLFDLYAPLTIVGEKESGNRALIVFRGKPVQGTDTMIAFQAKNEGGWKISTVVYGPLTSEYESLDPELLNF